MTRCPHLDDLERGLAGHEPRVLPAPARVFDRAAVALAFAGPPEDLRLCFIRRATRASDPWSGQMAFPGGREDASDASVQAVAQREAHEEVGLDLRRARLLGRLDDARLGRGRESVLASFVYDVGRERPELEPDPSEVAAAFWIGLGELWNVDAQTVVNWEHEGRSMTFPGIRRGPDTIWGLSLRVLARLAELVGTPLPLTKSAEFDR